MLDPEQAVERIRAAFRPPAGYRTLHAKGAFYSGTFTATPEATALSRAGHLSGETIPVTVRWSNAAGNPRVPDPKPDIRGMSVSWKLPDGTATDLLAQTSPRFPTKDPEEFVGLTEASVSPLRLPLFLLRHPHLVGSVLAGLTGGALASPVSFAEASFYPIHAYGWVDAAGTTTWVRYSFRPVATPEDRLEETFTGPDRLREEIVARLARGPVEHDVRVQVAGPGHDPHDPTAVWKGARELLAGRITVTETVSDPETEGAVVVFDPTRVVDGLELSDDPILRYRPAAYAESVSRRMQPRDG
jgi:catalase